MTRPNRKTFFPYLRTIPGIILCIAFVNSATKPTCEYTKAIRQAELGNHQASLKILERCPADDSVSHFWKGLNYHALYQPDPSLLHLKKAYGQGIRNDTLLIKLAEVFLWKKNFREASRLTEQVIDKRHPEFLKVKARHHEILGEFAEAIKLYDLAIAKEKLPYETMARKATVLSWAKDYDGAIALFTEIISAKKVLPPLRKNCLIRRAEVVSWKKDFVAALADLDAVLKMDKQNSEAILLKGKILEWQGEYLSAKKLYAEILSFDAENDQAKMRLEKLEWVK